MEERTVPVAIREASVRTVRVRVIDGPDATRAVEARGESVSVGSAPGNGLVLTDETASRFHAQLTARPDGVALVDHGSTNGTFVGATRVRDATVAYGTTLTVGRSSLRVEADDAAVVETVEGEALAGLRGTSESMRRLMAQVRRAAQSNVAVLIVGESGTGKELAARALHDLGPRAARPFVTVDCGALAPTLVASDLFGHERGAFTGADQRHAGAFERADGGTIFLDEIGELPTSLQPALLGALERRRFHRLGGKSDVSVDVRIVAATNRDLRTDVNAGTFRLDLYYRLAVVTLAMPALRDRVDDIPLLMEHFLREAGFVGTLAEFASPAVLAELRTHRWPGNVRELRNLVEATLAMGETPPTVAPDAKPAGGEGSSPLAALLDGPYKESRAAWLNEFERQYLTGLQARAGKNITLAARAAQLDRSYLAELLRKHSLI